MVHVSPICLDEIIPTHLSGNATTALAGVLLEGHSMPLAIALHNKPSTAFH